MPPWDSGEVTVYLDHAATAPLRPRARAAWLEAADVLGNASSIHVAGQNARRVLEESRETVAEALGCDPPEVVFTSGGTESVNLAIKGLWQARSGGDALVLPDGEHHATMETVSWLAATTGAVVRAVPIDAHGAIDVERFTDALPGAGTATALLANNETGTVNEVAALCAAAAAAGVPLHLDAVAAFGRVPLAFRDLRGTAAGPGGLSAMSVSAHKIGGPVGVGALVVARTARLYPQLHGGGQQRGLRAGTQDVAGAAAFAAAAAEATAERESEAKRLDALTERMLRGITAAVPDARATTHPLRSLPGHLQLVIPGAPGETVLFLLDRSGVAVSTGSACQAGVAEPSHVAVAMGLGEADSRCVLRISMGRLSSDADVDAFLDALPDAVAVARRAAAAF